MNTWEKVAISLSGTSTVINAAIAFAYVLSGGLKVVPQFVLGAAGFGGTPPLLLKQEGEPLGKLLKMLP